jgi:hypothetical protein
MLKSIKIILNDHCSNLKFHLEPNPNLYSDLILIQQLK